MVRDIRSNDSLRTHYQTMYNQCVVLLVSYFASAVQQVFETALPSKLKEGMPLNLEKIGYSYYKVDMDLEDLRYFLKELKQNNFADYTKNRIKSFVQRFLRWGYKD